MPSTTISIKDDHRLMFEKKVDGTPNEFVIDVPSVGDERIPVTYVRPADVPHVLPLLEDAWRCILGWKAELEEGKPPLSDLPPWSVMEKDHSVSLDRGDYRLGMLGYTEDGYQFAVDVAAKHRDGWRPLAQLGYLQIPIVIELLKEAKVN